MVQPSAGQPLVLVDRPSDHVAVLTINRPNASNSINVDTAAALGDAYEKLESDDSVHAVVLTGQGDRVFCAGADLKHMLATKQLNPSEPHRQGRGFAGLVARRRTTPLIAAVNGHAFGGGCEIALAADLVISAETAKFCLPEPSLGIFAAGGGALRLPTTIARHQAMEMLLLAEPRPADWLEKAGFIKKIVGQSDVLDTAIDWATTIAQHDREGIAATMRAAWFGLPDAELWQANDDAFDQRVESAEAEALLTAFAEGRK